MSCIFTYFPAVSAWCPGLALRQSSWTSTSKGLFLADSRLRGSLMRSRKAVSTAESWGASSSLALAVELSRPCYLPQLELRPAGLQAIIFIKMAF